MWQGPEKPAEISSQSGPTRGLHRTPRRAWASRGRWHPPIAFGAVGCCGLRSELKDSLRTEAKGPKRTGETRGQKQSTTEQFQLCNVLNLEDRTTCKTIPTVREGGTLCPTWDTEHVPRLSRDLAGTPRQLRRFGMTPR